MRLQIVDWDANFENNKSRERDECSFVCVPNKQDGMGLHRILALPDGAAIYGIWNLILGACSRQHKPREGHLTDTGRADGCQWTVDDMAFRWRRTPEEINRALEVLTSPKVGWIIDLDQSAREVPAECPSGAAKEGRNRREEKEPPPPVGGGVDGDGAGGITEHTTPRKPKSTSIHPPGFQRFWAAWPRNPRKASMTKCANIWKREGCEKIADHIVAVVEHLKKTRDWQKDNGQFIPAPMVWLNQGRWDLDPSDLATNSAKATPHAITSLFQRKQAGEYIDLTPEQQADYERWQAARGAACQTN